MANFNQQMQDLFARYQEEVSGGPANLRNVAGWAIRNGLWKPHVSDLVSTCSAQLARALREEYRVDEQGRRYRAKHAVTERKGGKQTSLWADIDSAPRHHMEKAFAQRRKQIVGDCFQLRQDVDHYNDVNHSAEPIQLVLDFTDDVEERMIEVGIDCAA